MTGSRDMDSTEPPAVTRGRNFIRTPLGATAVAAVLLLGIGLRLGNLGNVAFRSPDERVCTRQANSVLDEGASGLRRLVVEFRTDSTWSAYPSPTRAGYIWLLAGVMRATGVRDERAGAYLSCAASIGSLFVLTLLGMRFFPSWAALCALLFFAVSPMEIALARRAWQDALVGFLGLSLVYTASELTRDPRRRAWYLMFVVLGTAGITVKELAAVAYGMVALCILWVLMVRRRDWRSGLKLMGAGLVGAVAGVAWLANAVGGLDLLVGIVAGLPGLNATLSYSLEYETGPAYRMLQGFWIGSPLATVLCALGLAHALLPGRIRTRGHIVADDIDREVVCWIAIFVLSFLALPMIYPRRQNLRYMSVIFGSYYLMAGLGFWLLASLGRDDLRPWRRWVGPAVAIAMAAAGVAADVRFFRKAIVQQGLQDLSIGMLLGAGESERPRHVKRDSGPRRPTSDEIEAAETAARLHPSPESWLNLSLQYELAGRHQECIDASMRALALKPDYAEAYNNIASAYESMARWDEAIEAAQRALELKPDFELARNNLEYSLSMKRRRAR